jgi:hypothetical protein
MGHDFRCWARNGHGPMSDLSPLSGEERKSNFGAVRSVDDPNLTLMPLLDHSSARTLGRSSFALIRPCSKHQVARDDAGRPPALEAARRYQARASTPSAPGLGMRFGPNGRILDWRRIRVHSAGRYGHEAPVGRLGARKSATAHA